MRRQTKFTGISPAVWRECWERDGGICRHCGKGGVLQAAHYVSRARGGMGIPTNLVMLCPECHREADQGDGKEIKREMREYLESMYPLWSEEKQIPLPCELTLSPEKDYFARGDVPDEGSYQKCREKHETYRVTSISRYDYGLLQHLEVGGR